MDKKPIHYHHCKILLKYKLLSVKSFSDLCFLKLTFKCLNNIAPEPLSSFVQRKNINKVTRDSNNNNCIVPYHMT